MPSLENRYLVNHLIKDLQKKMVFLGGPRQGGKTCVSKLVLNRFPFEKNRKGLYFNWDDGADRRDIINETWGDEHQILVLDELHKYPKWKNWLKGKYDKQKTKRNFFVTGSARLDVYKRGGDSLMGRYHYWRLHPFTISEIPIKISNKEILKRLMTLGGFPEPFLDNDEREARRWRKERFDKIIKDDVRDLESIKNIQDLALFTDLLRTRVGQLVVLNNMAKDLQISPVTAKKWLAILEKMYMLFCVRPYTKNIARAIQKPPKVFFFDNADVIGDEGARFENLVATTLLKRIHYIEDYTGFRCELNYIRDKEGREVDFVVSVDGKIKELIEVKYSDNQISKSLTYYAERLQPDVALQIVAKPKRCYSKGKIRVETPFESLSKSPWK